MSTPRAAPTVTTTTPSTPDPTQTTVTSSARTPRPSSSTDPSMLALPQTQSSSVNNNNASSLSFMSSTSASTPQGTFLPNNDSLLLLRGQPQPFPDHQIFTFIPQIYELITRLRIYKEAIQQQQQQQNQNNNPIQNDTMTKDKDRENGDNSNKTTTTITSSPVQSRSDPNTLSKTISKESTFSSSGTGTGLTKTSSASATAEETLEIKDLPEKLYEIRQAIQRARDIVAGLPDVKDWNLERQKKEIGRLEGLVGGLKGRIKELGELASVGDGVVDEKRLARRREDQSDVETMDVIMQGVEG